MENLTTQQLRVINARHLASAFGTKKEFCEATHLQLSQYSHLLGENARAKVGDIVARKIEEGCGKPAGWLDINHEGGKDSNQELITIDLAVETLIAMRKELEKLGTDISNLPIKTLRKMFLLNLTHNQQYKEMVLEIEAVKKVAS